MPYVLDPNAVVNDYVYPSDDGNDYLIKLSSKYATVSGLTAAGGGNTAIPRYPYSHKFLRHMYWTVIDGNKQHTRRIPCKKYTPAAAPPSTGSFDGETTWKHGSLIGERVKL